MSSYPIYTHAAPVAKQQGPPQIPGLMVVPLRGCGSKGRGEGTGMRKLLSPVPPVASWTPHSPYIIALQCGQNKGNVDLGLSKYTGFNSTDKTAQPEATEDFYSCSPTRTRLSSLPSLPNPPSQSTQQTRLGMQTSACLCISMGLVLCMVTLSSRQAISHSEG